MEQLVVDLWEENKDGYFGARKRRLIYKEMAATISAAGLSVIWTDVRSKLENLIRKYRIEREKAKQGIPSRWRHYKKIHSILNGDRPSRPESRESIKAEPPEGQ
ncbi:hypothetical protein KR054_000376 [Drosophila jambulina]|nr:hypothetical protein KR054_000376 [Drosophila jambulina]